MADSPSYSLPIATTTILGGVKPDGTTISVDATGKISTTATVSTQQNKIVYIKIADPDANSLWTANYDGTNAQKINVAIPANFGMDDEGLSISPDHKTVFFMLYPINGDTNGDGRVDKNDIPESVYACNIDGSNMHIVATGSDTAIAY